MAAAAAPCPAPVVMEWMLPLACCMGGCCESQPRTGLNAPPCRLQAKDAMDHPYFDDLDKDTVDLLENPELAARGDDE